MRMQPRALTVAQPEARRIPGGELFPTMSKVFPCLVSTEAGSEQKSLFCLTETPAWVGLSLKTWVVSQRPCLQH